jgi:hypothetical protein
MKKIIFIFFVSSFILNNCAASSVSMLSSGTASCFKEGKAEHEGVSFDGLKIEGITLSEDGKIFLVADQDRVPTGIEGKPRELYEVPYMVLKAK